MLGRDSPVEERPQRLVADLLESSGVAVRRHDEAPLELRGVDAVWILGNANWYPRAVRELLALERARRPPVVLWHWERLPPPAASGLRWPLPTLLELRLVVRRHRQRTDVYSNLHTLRRLHRRGFPEVLITSTASRVELLAEHGIAAHLAPLGWAPIHGRDLGLERDVEVLFLGQMERFGRRVRLLRRLRRRGVPVVARGDYFDADLWGEARNRLLNRTQIYLNVHRFPGEFSGLRMVTGMANRALIVSEPMYRPSPFVPGEHYVEAPFEELPAAVERYRADRAERERITARAHRLVTGELTLARSVGLVLGWTREALAERATR